MAYVALLGREHIGPTGDYVWTAPNHNSLFRPLHDLRATFPLPAA